MIHPDKQLHVKRELIEIEDSGDVSFSLFLGAHRQRLAAGLIKPEKPRFIVHWQSRFDLVGACNYFWSFARLTEEEGPLSAGIMRPHYKQGYRRKNWRHILDLAERYDDVSLIWFELPRCHLAWQQNPDGPGYVVVLMAAIYEPALIKDVVTQTGTQSLRVYSEEIAFALGVLLDYGFPMEPSIERYFLAA